MHRVFLPLLLAAVLPGCVAVAAAGVAGFGLVQYQRNEAELDVVMDLNTVWQGSLEGLRRLGIETPTQSLGPTERTLEHDDIEVRVERHPEGFTRVRVRVGSFYTQDRERRAQLILQEIERVLDEEDQLRAWAEKVKRE